VTPFDRYFWSKEVVTDTDEESSGQGLGNVIPLIGRDDAPPGWWEPDPARGGASTWRGEFHWRKRYGDAEVDYLFGKPRRVLWARLPDGAVVESASTLSPSEDDLWRWPTMDGPGCRLATLDIRDNGAFLTPCASRPEPRFQAEAPDIRCDLAEDPEFVERLGDMNTALAVYLAFCNTEYVSSGESAPFQMSWRAAGKFVADVRMRNESYLDFYLSGVEDIDAAAGSTSHGEADRLDAWFLTVVERLGWRRGRDEADLHKWLAHRKSP
jgi:hypothetical protein